MLNKRQVLGWELKKKVKVDLWMNALLELKLLNPRITMISWQPNLITSLESPSDSVVLVKVRFS